MTRVRGAEVVSAEEWLTSCGGSVVEVRENKVEHLGNFKENGNEGSVPWKVARGSLWTL